jgi:hypothetical protein
MDRQNRGELTRLRVVEACVQPFPRQRRRLAAHRPMSAVLGRPTSGSKSRCSTSDCSPTPRAPTACRSCNSRCGSSNGIVLGLFPFKQFSREISPATGAFRVPKQFQDEFLMVTDMQQHSPARQKSGYFGVIAIILIVANDLQRRDMRSARRGVAEVLESNYECLGAE